MTKRLAALAALLTLTACTPVEIAYHLTAATEAEAEGLACPELAGWVRLAGFTEHEAPTVHRLMYAESRCDPTARSPAGAIGVLQVMPAWADDCGIQPADLYDPVANIRCARHVYEVQGFGAWDTY